MFQHTIFELGIIYFAFFSFLTSSLIGYFINYRSILLYADEKNNNVRYLCEDATKTYSFKDGSSYNGVKDAGATVTTYHLRLVKHIRLHLR